MKNPSKLCLKALGKSKRHKNKYTRHWLETVKLDNIKLLAASESGAYVYIDRNLYNIVGVYASMYTRYGYVDSSPPTSPLQPNGSSMWMGLGNDDTSDYGMQMGHCCICGTDSNEYGTPEEFSSPTNCLFIEVHGTGTPAVQTAYWPEYAPDEYSEVSYGIEVDVSGSSHPQGALWNFYSSTMDGYLQHYDSIFASSIGRPIVVWFYGECRRYAVMPGTIEDQAAIYDCSWWYEDNPSPGVDPDNLLSYYEEIDLTGSPIDEAPYTTAEIDDGVLYIYDGDYS